MAVSPEASPEPDEAELTAAHTEQAARQFDELMDTFSLHHYIIRHGLTLDTTPEFASFGRKYAADWGAIQELNAQLEQLMRKYNVPLAYVDGQKLAALAADPLASRGTQELLECLVNSEQVRACMEVLGRATTRRRTRRPSRRPRCRRRRGCLARKQGKQTKLKHYAALKITRAAKLRVVQSWAAVAHAASQRQAMWEKLASQFARDWPRMKEPRVIIHLASLSLSKAQRASIPDLDVRQNAQLPRLCDVRLPGVDVVYVAFALNEDISQYFSKVLEIGGVATPERRYKVVVPENLDRFPRTLSSRRCCSTRPRRCGASPTFAAANAFIVPSVVGPEEQRLAVTLGIPLLAPAPSDALPGSKSGSKRIFNAAQVNAPGLHDVYDEAILAGLARLICTHLDVPRWIFKLDDEFGGGHAHFDVGEHRCYQDLLRAHDALAAHVGGPARAGRDPGDSGRRAAQAAARARGDQRAGCGARGGSTPKSLRGWAA